MFCCLPDALALITERVERNETEEQKTRLVTNTEKPPTLTVLMFSREILWVKQLLPLLRHTSDSGCVRQTALILENQTIVFVVEGNYITGLILSTKPQQRQTLLGQPL